MGHSIPPRHPDDTGHGHCPFHGACFEGLASGPAIIKRWAAPLSALAGDHPAHDITAFYLGHLVQTVRMTLAPHRIILGGGVMRTPGLLDRLRAAAIAIDGGYQREGLAEMLVAPGLGDNAGLLGAIALAIDAASATTAPPG